MSDSEEDIEIQLCRTSLAALEKFYKEREERENLIRAGLTEPDASDVIFDEDWQLSQFWYDDKTVQAFTKGIILSTENDAKVALVSCPSLYKKVKRASGHRTVTLYEYDQRFAAYGDDYMYYDYKYPQAVPSEMTSGYDLVIADPPFLSEECLEKMAKTIKFLSKKNIVICTGAVMADLVESLLGVKKCKFVPQHKNNLANEFCCFANFDFDEAIERVHE